MKALARLASPDDAENFCKWMSSTKDNLFDPSISTYPSLRTLAVDVDGKTSLYMPFHPVLVIESLAHSPEITPRQNAYALHRAEATVIELAKEYGMAEILWFCKDESLVKHALRYGYEVVQVPVLRKRVNHVPSAS